MNTIALITLLYFAWPCVGMYNGDYFNLVDFLGYGLIPRLVFALALGLPLGQLLFGLN